MIQSTFVATIAATIGICTTAFLFSESEFSHSEIAEFTSKKGQESDFQPDQKPSSTRYRCTFYGSFIYWLPYEDGLEFAVTGIAALVNNTTPPTKRGTMYRPNFDFTPGFRLGACYRQATEWSLNAMWTCLSAKASRNVVSQPPGVFAGLSPNDLWGVWGASGGGYGAVNFANADWRLQYNTVELITSIPCRVKRNITIKPAFGVIYAGINQSYNIRYGADSDEDLEEIHIRNNFQGGGFRGLVGFDWEVNRHFGICARAGCNLVLGQFELNQYQLTTPDIVYLTGKFLNVGDDPLSMKPEIDAALGAYGVIPFYCNRYSFKWAVEWDFINWLDQNQMMKFYGPRPVVAGDVNADPYGGHFNTQHGDLFLQGLTVTAGLEF